MRAIAWDDARKDDGSDYMSRLAAELQSHGIQVTVEKETREFERRVRDENFDFFICDWFNTEGRSGVPRGEEIPGGDLLVNVIRRYNKTSPIFIVSRHTGRVNGHLLGGFRPIFLKSKDVNVQWMSYDIRDNLGDLGIMVDSKKVFIIYGHDRRADGATSQLETWLDKKGVTPVRLDARRSRHGILPDLMREMNTCAAFIAVCTPDDYCEEGFSRGKKWWQPRQNVLFEMGVVFGLHRGAQRLTVLQKWIDDNAEECALLPSDWGGYVTIHFADNIKKCFESLEGRLRELGVDLDNA